MVSKEFREENEEMRAHKGGGGGVARVLTKNGTASKNQIPLSFHSAATRGDPATHGGTAELGLGRLLRRADPTSELAQVRIGCNGGWRRPVGAFTHSVLLQGFVYCSLCFSERMHLNRLCIALLVPPGQDLVSSHFWAACTCSQRSKKRTDCAHILVMHRRSQCLESGFLLGESCLPPLIHTAYPHVVPSHQCDVQDLDQVKEPPFMYCDNRTDSFDSKTRMQ